MAIVHTWRNLRRRRCAYEEVEKELHKKDQEEEDKKRDPEEPERFDLSLCQLLGLLMKSY